jgi:hypothetical protein
MRLHVVYMRFESGKLCSKLLIMYVCMKNRLLWLDHKCSLLRRLCVYECVCGSVSARACMRVYVYKYVYACM